MKRQIYDLADERKIKLDQRVILYESTELPENRTSRDFLYYVATRSFNPRFSAISKNRICEPGLNITPGLQPIQSRIVGRLANPNGIQA